MPQHLVQFLNTHFLELWLLAISWVVVSFTFKYFWHRSKGRFFQDPPTSDVLYSEGYASGRSLKSWFTRLGGASNCLRVVLTHERLFVRPAFPFLILGPDFDLVHSVPLKNIESAIRKDRTLMKQISIRFRLADGATREIEITSKKSDQFESTLSALIGDSK